MNLLKMITQAGAILLLSSITLLPISVTAAQSDIHSGKVISKTQLPSEHGLSEASEQYLIKYESISGVDGKTSRQDTAAVFLPKGKAPHNGWPVVVWAHGTIGVATDCAPSLNPRTDRDKQYLNTWLSLGFAVVSPDYAGLGSDGLHHYMDAKAEAWSVLDGARAALSAFPLRNQLVLVGQSQGAHAAFASAGYQPSYAPQLNVVATVLTGTPYFDETTTAEQILGQSSPDKPDPKMAYIFYIYLSAADTNSSLKAEDYFLDKALPILKMANTLCIAPLTKEVYSHNLNPTNSLKPAIDTLLNTQMATMQYPTLHIAHPVFIGIGDSDINVPTSMQQRFAAAVKAAGTDVEVHEYEGLDHSGTVNPSLRDSVPFVLKAMASAEPK